MKSFFSNLFCCCAHNNDDTYPGGTSESKKYHRILPPEDDLERTSIEKSIIFQSLITFREEKEQEEKWIS